MIDNVLSLSGISWELAFLVFFQGKHDLKLETAKVSTDFRAESRQKCIDIDVVVKMMLCCWTLGKLR